MLAPLETMEQFLFTFLSKKYGLKVSLNFEVANIINNIETCIAVSINCSKQYTNILAQRCWCSPVCKMPKEWMWLRVSNCLRHCQRLSVPCSQDRIKRTILKSKWSRNKINSWGFKRRNLFWFRIKDGETALEKMLREIVQILRPGQYREQSNWRNSNVQQQHLVWSIRFIYRWRRRELVLAIKYQK